MTRTSRIRAAVLALGVAAATAPLLVAPATAYEGFTFDRVDGTTGPGRDYSPLDRYATAGEIALRLSGDGEGGGRVYLARGDAFADALATSYASRVDAAPVLLTGPDALPDNTLITLQALDPDEVVLVGGPGAITPAVDAQLQDEGFATDRIAGTDRFDTAAQIVRAATQGAPLGFLGEVDDRRAVLLASGRDFPDGLSGGALSYGAALPLLLTEPTSLPEATAAVIEDLDIEQVVVLGGTSAVSDAVAAEAAALTGNDPIRVDGDDRYATSAAIADFAYDRLSFDRARVTLARGDAFADALAGGSLAGSIGAPVLLTPSDALRAPTASLLQQRCPLLEDGLVFGGTAAVSTQVEQAARTLAAGCDRDTPPASTQIRYRDGGDDTVMGDDVGDRLTVTFDEPVTLGDDGAGFYEAACDEQRCFFFLCGERADLCTQVDDRTVSFEVLRPDAGDVLPFTDGEPTATLLTFGVQDSARQAGSIQGTVTVEQE